MIRSLGLVGGEYRLGREIGRGGFGAVYVGRAESTGQIVALKLLSRFEPGAAARLEREAQVLLRLAPHPGVVQVFAAGRHANLPYYVMELVRGRSLLALAQAGLWPTVEQAVDLVERVLAALGHLHDAGVVHRDLKPSNVLLDERGEPRLVDFGLALDTERVTRLTASDELVGSPFALAPEQLRGAAQPETDLYGAGALLYELVTRQPPYGEARTAREFVERLATSAPTPPAALNPALPAALARVIERALARDPNDRPRPAAELARQLRAALGATNAGAGSSFGGSLAGAAAELDALAPVLPGTVVNGEWTITEELGRGGAGVVMRARSSTGAAEVAIKFLNHASDAARARFERERRILGGLGAGQGFVPLLSVGEHGRLPYFVMPLVEGGTLRDRLSRGPLPLAEAVGIARKLSRAVAHCHSLGIVHRDLKPENVLFTSEGEPLVADLGLAKHFRDDDPTAADSISVSRTGEFRGTPIYMSPEQTRDAKSATSSTDVYALGAILYECLTGEPPFNAPTFVALLAAIVTTDAPPVRRLRPDTPDWLAAVVARALAREPGARYADAASLLAALSRRPARTGRAVTAVLAGAAAVVAVTTVLLVARPRAHTAAASPAPPAPPRPAAPIQDVWPGDLDDLGSVDQEWGKAQSGRSVSGKPLTIGTEKFAHGVGTHAVSDWTIDLDGAAVRFEATVGLDASASAAPNASVIFRVLVDGVSQFDSGVMLVTTPSRTLSVSLEKAKRLRLLVQNAGEGIDYDHADWAAARITYRGARPTSWSPPREPLAILARPQDPTPRINGPAVLVFKPGSPVDYTIPVAGEGPFAYVVSDLPEGLIQSGGRIVGPMPRDVKSSIHVKVTGGSGTAERVIEIMSRDRIVGPPPLGWNSYFTYGTQPTDAQIRAAADAIVAKGLSRHGWSYIVIDDGWQSGRDASGIVADPSRFPDMKKLAEYLHAKGLKLGIFAAASAHTGSGFTGSLGNESKDMARFASWGVDLVRYDAVGSTGPTFDDSVRKVASALQGRNVLLTVLQDGRDEPILERGEPCAHSWLSRKLVLGRWPSIERVGFRTSAVTVPPGSAIDLGLLHVGKMVAVGGKTPNELSPDEACAQLSLWCLRGSPLFFGGDPRTFDPSTVSLLSNDEVLDVALDPLRDAANRVRQDELTEVWARKIEDPGTLKHAGRLAVGFFARGPDERRIRTTWRELGMTGAGEVRDLWRQKRVETDPEGFTVVVRPHGVVLVTVTPPH